jgi:hypothetical protein
VPVQGTFLADVPAKEKRHAFPRMSVIHPTPIRTLWERLLCRADRIETRTVLVRSTVLSKPRSLFDPRDRVLLFPMRRASKRRKLLAILCKPCLPTWGGDMPDAFPCFA